MEKESLEVINSSENQIHVEYEEPPFYKRAFANLLDIIFLFLFFITFFIVVENVVHVTPIYKDADQLVATKREESGLFMYADQRKTWENVSTWLDNDGSSSYDYRVLRCEKAIEDFTIYIKNELGEEKYNEIIKDYDECRLSDKLVAEDGKKLFVLDEHNHVVPNTIPNPHGSDPLPVANQQYYYEHFYREYTLTNCGSFMIINFPEYHNALTVMSNLFFFLQLPVSVVLASLFTYFIPTLFFKHGRMTFGKRLMSVGLVDSRVLSPTIWRYLARWAIFVFGELILSFFTFGIPFIVSTTMMAFTKRHQGFPDYMLGLVEVDTTKQKIYIDKYEIALEQARDHKEAPEFKMDEDK